MFTIVHFKLVVINALGPTQTYILTLGRKHCQESRHVTAAGGGIVLGLMDNTTCNMKGAHYKYKNHTYIYVCIYVDILQ